MKKTLFYIPAIVSVIFYGAVALIGIGSISPVVIAWIALFCISGFIMGKGRFLGALFGMLPAIYIIYMGSQETGQVFKETPIGIAVLLFYLVCGYIVYRKTRNNAA